MIISRPAIVRFGRAELSLQATRYVLRSSLYLSLPELEPAFALSVKEISLNTVTGQIIRIDSAPSVTHDNLCLK